VSTEDEWLWGWDDTPGIVSVWAEPDGRALVWRRDPEDRQLLREEARFRPWLLLASLADLQHVGERLCDERAPHTPAAFTFRELEGPGALRYLVRGGDGRALSRAVLSGAERRVQRRLGHLRELGDSVLALPPEEQYLVDSGRTYFRGLAFGELVRMQFDLETTGLDPERDRVFLISLRDGTGGTELLEAGAPSDAAEADLIARFVQRVQALDPDVIENHNLHGFDLPFLVRRAERLGVPLALGRTAHRELPLRPSARGARFGPSERSQLAERLERARYTIPGRETIDTMDAVRRYDFAARELPGHGLKAVARHFGLTPENRELIPGALIARVYQSDPERVRRYAAADVHEAAAVAELLGGAAFALARMAPRRYERLSDAGPATGVLDPLLLRAYLRAGAALPAREPGDGTPHSGAALRLFATGVARRVVKADVASLYPSLMRAYGIGPARDRLGVLLALVDRLLDQRLAAKAAGRRAPAHSPARHTHEALSAAMKIVINSAYGYLGAATLTRFADVHAANEITRRGREILSSICAELARRGVTLLEADTDGVYFAVPESFGEADERRIVAEVAACLPKGVQLEFDGRYAAMLSHEAKNYALLGYDGTLVLRGVAFRSSRVERFGEQFLRDALSHLLRGDVAAVREAYLGTLRRLRTRALPTAHVSARVRLTKTADEYLAAREQRRELGYEALLASGRREWMAGEQIRVYRAAGGRPALLQESDGESGLGGATDANGATGELADAADSRDYDVDYYARLLRDVFASRLVRALSAEDFAAVFADPEQLTLFAPDLSQARTVLTVLPDPVREVEPPASATIAAEDEPGDPSA
jgi:DNA polymerase elongation subunit (family B)